MHELNCGRIGLLYKKIKVDVFSITSELPAVQGHASKEDSKKAITSHSHSQLGPCVRREDHPSCEVELRFDPNDLWVGSSGLHIYLGFHK